MWLGSLSSRSFLQTYPSSTSPKVLNLHIVDFYSSKAPNKRKKNLKCFWKTISKAGRSETRRERCSALSELYGQRIFNQGVKKKINLFKNLCSMMVQVGTYNK
ncbi:uncharacterized protein LOC133777522 isoform X2 [Humulus lupulus]|uniref:uncharacterized protein LOC133777522 isoform X2 n=1 Tax=Humulus lupulus TaxID=3486 RepID=UPI002B411560|nr:uncharacterized protein LOC133777522 isoform X2 [Humulus lupulus]